MSLLEDDESQLNLPVARIKLDNNVTISVTEASLPLLIGREPCCGIAIPKAVISRRHCELYLSSNQLYIRDISTNGTVVGEKRLKNSSVLIQDECKLVVGDHVLMTITPIDSEGSIGVRHVIAERRPDDRRKLDRRANVIMVNFDRRQKQNRRGEERRVASHS